MISEGSCDTEGFLIKEMQHGEH